MVFKLQKEKDLELAARIGQQLLEQNRNLEERVTVLEHENRESTETITQLKHDLLFKQQLLELYNDSCNSEESSKAGECHLDFFKRLCGESDCRDLFSYV